jgi:hypothetical protein
MIFNVTEIKKLGRGFDMNLSIRMEGGDNTRYTIHAVLPYTPEFGQLQIGQEFELKKSEIKPINNSIIDAFHIPGADPNYVTTVRNKT